MLSAKEWWAIMEAYGEKIWPAQTLLFIAAVALVVWLFLKPGRVPDALVKLYLVLALAWNGIVFFFILAKGIAGNGNYLFGSMLTVAALLLAVDFSKQKVAFRLPELRWQKYLTLVLMLLVFCYPLFGMAFGHRFPRLIIPGTFPCPTTALSLLLLTTALPQVNKIAYILLLLWAVPFPPFIQIPKYGVYEDAIMFVVGVYSMIMLVKNWKVEKISKQGFKQTSLR